MKCPICKYIFSKPEQDIACGEDICPKCKNHMPSKTCIFDLPINCDMCGTEISTKEYYKMQGICSRCNESINGKQKRNGKE